MAATDANYQNKNQQNKEHSDNTQNEHISDPNRDGTNNYKHTGTHYSSQIYSNEQRQYRNAREYAQAVQSWLWQYRMWVAFSSFQSQLISAIPPPTNFRPNQNVYNHQNSAFGMNPPRVGTETPTSVQGTTYKIPMLWKRIVAEFLDFVLLFYTKILITVAVLRQMGYVNENLLDLEAQFPILSEFGELDYDKMFTLTSELIALEVVNRLCITLVETMCIRQGYAGTIGGATPGKKIMLLRVVSFDEVRDLSNGQLLVIGARDPGFVNALVRSVIKNFSMAFFFPACFTVFFFRFNRAAYDILSQTVVVEEEHRHNH